MRTISLTRTAAVALGSLALAAPAASAMIDRSPGRVASGASAGVSDAAQRAAGETNTSSVVSEPYTAPAAGDGLQWADFALGAGASLFLIAVVGAGGAAISRRPTGRPVTR